MIALFQFLVVSYCFYLVERLVIVYPRGLFVFSNFDFSRYLQQEKLKTNWKRTIWVGGIAKSNVSFVTNKKMAKYT